MKKLFLICLLATACSEKDDVADPFSRVQQPAIPAAEGIVVNADFAPYVIGQNQIVFTINKSDLFISCGDGNKRGALISCSTGQGAQSINKEGAIKIWGYTENSGSHKPDISSVAPASVTIVSIDTVSSPKVIRGFFQATVQAKTGKQGHIKGAFNAQM